MSETVAKWAHHFLCTKHGVFWLVGHRRTPMTGSCPKCDADPWFNTDIDAGPYGLLGGVVQPCVCCAQVRA